MRFEQFVSLPGLRVVSTKIRDTVNAYCPVCEAGRSSSEKAHLYIYNHPDKELFIPHCVKGCGLWDIMSALGLDLKDIHYDPYMPSTYAHTGKGRPKKPGFKVTELPKASPVNKKTQLPEECATTSRHHEYFTASGKKALKQIDYIEDKDGKPGKKCSWYLGKDKGYGDGRIEWIYGLQGETAMPYLWDTVTDDDRPILIPEGEKDVETVLHIMPEVIAISMPNGKHTPVKVEGWTDKLQSHPVYILADNDEPGIEGANNLGIYLAQRGINISIVHASDIWPDVPYKGDISDILQMNRYKKHPDEGITVDRVREWLSQAMENATPIPYEADKDAQRENKSEFNLPSLRDEILPALGIEVRKNQLSQAIEVTGGVTVDGETSSIDSALAYIMSGYSSQYFGISTNKATLYLNEIARCNAYNPWRDRLRSLPHWDGHDYFSDLFTLMGLEDEDKLSRELIRKWFYQIWVISNNGYTDATKDQSLPLAGILVLQGKQGCGKTSLFRMFAFNRQDWFGEGRELKDVDKDTFIQAISYPITELGEVESTLKSDINHLKAFITKTMDEYRKPYAHDGDRTYRRTTFCASCNSDEYLIDPTGNRRFWSVKISKFVKHSDIVAFPIDKLYAQVIAEVGNNLTGDVYQLTDEASKALDERNKAMMKPIPYETEIRDLLINAETYDDKFRTIWITATNWKASTGFGDWQAIDALKNASSRAIAMALNAIGFSKENGNKRITRGSCEYLLPVPIAYINRLDRDF